MEVKINREIRNYTESMFFGLSFRQFVFSLLAVGVAIVLYFALKPHVGTETVSWMCILGAAPFAAMGFISYKSRVSMFYVAYSGGKDSIVMLDIVQRALPHDGFVVVFGDTTMELKTTYQALFEAKAHWPSLEWYEARTEFEAEESWRRIGFPARKLRWCCSVHKTAPSIAKLKEIYKTKYPEAQRPFKVMVFDGVRAEESDARSTYTMISDGNKHAVQFNCSPILEWSSCELFLYIFKYRFYGREIQRGAVLPLCVGDVRAGGGKTT